jgi:hypothetical protein
MLAELELKPPEDTDLACSKTLAPPVCKPGYGSQDALQSPEF